MFNFKFLMLNWLLVGVVFGYEAKNITVAELEKLKSIDKTIYALSTKKFDFNFNEVLGFVLRNLNYDLDFTRLKIISSARASKNTSDTVRADGTVSTQRENLNIGLTLTYPLFDRKERSDRKKQIFENKKKITKDIKEYFKIKSELYDLKLEDAILRQIEIRSKARKLDGVGGFNDWLKVLKDIKKNNLNLSLKKLEIEEKKQVILNYVLPNYKTKLKDML